MVNLTINTHFICDFKYLVNRIPHYTAYRFKFCDDHFITDVQMYYLPTQCVGLTNIFLSEPLDTHSLLNNNYFTTFPLTKTFPHSEEPPPCFFKKSRSKEHFTCLISPEIYDLRKLIVMDIPQHLTEVLSLSRGDTALGEHFFFRW